MTHTPRVHREMRHHWLTCVMTLVAPIAALVPSAGPGLAIRRSVTLNNPTPGVPRDLTADVSAALPAIGWALVHVASDDGSLAIVDPAVLNIGQPEQVAPSFGRSSRGRLALAVRDGQLVLPEGARLYLLPTTEQSRVSLHVEASEELLTAPPELSGAAAVRQAALRASLSAQGASASDLRALEAADEPRAANRAFDSFVHGLHRPEELLPAARRAAQAIRHLLRQQHAELRNSDSEATAAANAKLAKHPLTLLLDNLRSAYNVGSLFRTADTARCAEIVTCGFTPHPPHPKLSKTAFGALASVPTRHSETTLAAVRRAQAAGLRVFAMETVNTATNCFEASFPTGGVALVLGNEEVGVRPRRALGPRSSSGAHCSHALPNPTNRWIPLCLTSATV